MSDIFIMKTLAAFLLMLALSSASPPVTRKDNVKETLHGVEIADPYRWLEDQNSPETREWIARQNEYSHAIFAKLPGRDELKRRYSELYKIDQVDSPTERGGRYFFSKRLAGQDLSVLYVRKGLQAQDEVLLDPHSLSADHTTSAN